MRAFMRHRISIPVVSFVALFAWSAQAQQNDNPQQGQGHPNGQRQKTIQPQKNAVQPPRGGQIGQGGQVGQSNQVQRPVGQVRGPQNPGAMRASLPARNFAGRPYRGRMAWEGGRWRHEMHNGRNGWWWDVGGVWYFYPQQMDGPPSYVSDVEVTDDAYADVPDDAGGPPPGGAYPPPVAYAPPPPPPPPDPAAGAVGGAIVGGLLGGLITGRPVGAAVGAITGGTIGAIAGAQAAARPGYYLAQGNCYYKYPSGQYVQVDPRSCY